MKTLAAPFSLFAERIMHKPLWYFDPLAILITKATCGLAS